jgi:hypothetical protein
MKVVGEGLIPSLRRCGKGGSEKMRRDGLYALRSESRRRLLLQSL